MVEVVSSPHSSSNHVDFFFLKYQINSSASLVWGASDSTRVQAILMHLGGMKGSAAALWMKFLVSASFLYRSERLPVKTCQ